MDYIGYLKDKIKEDKQSLKEFLNPFTHFTSVGKTCKIIFLILFFPYLIMLWYAIQIYKHLYIYFFTILDIIILQKTSKKKYKRFKSCYNFIKKILHQIFFFSIFSHLPNLYGWIRKKLSFQAWMDRLIYIVGEIVGVGVFFVNCILRFLLWLDQIDETYRNYRFYWVARHELIAGWKWARNLKRKKKKEREKAERLLREETRKQKILLLKLWIVNNILIKILDFILYIYDTFWLLRSRFYFYPIYFEILKTFKHPIIIFNKNAIILNIKYYIWKFYEIYVKFYSLVARRFDTPQINLYRIKIYNFYLFLRDSFSLLNIYRLYLAYYFLISRSFIFRTFLFVFLLFIFTLFWFF